MRIRFGSEMYAPTITSVMEEFDKTDHPWETTQDKMVKIMEDISRNLSLLTKDNKGGAGVENFGGNSPSLFQIERSLLQQFHAFSTRRESKNY